MISGGFCVCPAVSPPSNFLNLHPCVTTIAKCCTFLSDQDSYGENRPAGEDPVRLLHMWREVKLDVVSESDPLHKLLTSVLLFKLQQAL